MKDRITKLYGWTEMNECAATIDETKCDLSVKDDNLTVEPDGRVRGLPGYLGEGHQFITFRKAKSAAVNQAKEQVKVARGILKFLQNQTAPE